MLFTYSAIAKPSHTEAVDATIIPRSAVLRHQRNYAGKLADAVAALEAADDKLGQAADEFDEDAASSCDLFDVKDSRITVRVVAGMLNTGEMPIMPRRVFHAIASHGNENVRNTPHLEGVIVALELAHDALESALDLNHQLDGDDIDEAYEVPYAAWQIVKTVFANLGSAALPFDEEKALETIGAADRPLALAA